MNFFSFGFFFDKVENGISYEEVEDHNCNTLLLNNGEIELARANSVILCIAQKIYAHKKRKIKDYKAKLKGLLIITNFRLSFLLFNDKYETVRFTSSYQENYFLTKYDITLSNIDEVYGYIDNKQKQLHAHQKCTSKIDAIRIVCKNFRMMSFDFSECLDTERGREFTNKLLRVAFPAKHNDLFLYSFRDKYYGPSRRIKKFDMERDWIEELKRCGLAPSKDGWRVLQRNLPELEDALPKSFVVPEHLTNESYFEYCKYFARKRGVVWVWSTSSGASLLRMPDFLPESSRNRKKDSSEHVMERIFSNLKTLPCCMKLSDCLPSLKDVYQSYILLRELCIPQSDRDLMIQDENYLTRLERTNWLSYVSSCLKLANNCAEMLQEGQSVVLQEFEGRDMSCVISSIVQIQLDPHLRTIRGFQDLIQKEWVALGHPFSDRIGHVHKEGTEQSPLFLLFLDCVWQMLNQFPDSFQYTETFLTTTWDSVFIPVFATFQFNCEAEREKATRREAVIERPIWDWQESLERRDVALFVNPLYKFRDKKFNFEVSANRDKDDPIKPSHFIWDLEVFSQCYYRFMPLLEILNGGSVQIDWFNRVLLTGKIPIDANRNSKNEADDEGEASTSTANQPTTFIPLLNSFYPFSYFNESHINIPVLNGILLPNNEDYNDLY